MTCFRKGTESKDPAAQAAGEVAPANEVFGEFGRRL